MRKGDIKGSPLFKGKTRERKLYSELFKEFYLNIKIRGRAEDTLRTYKYHYGYFVKFVGENIYCDEIKLETFENYIIYLQDIRKISNGITINSYLQNISPTVKFGVKKGLIDNFEIPYVKTQETFKEIYTPDELKTLLKEPNKKDFVTLRTWATIWTFASTGVRASELRNLKVKGVDLLNRTIAVNHTKNKKARYLPISSSLSEVLIEYFKIRKGEGDDYLFPSIYNNMIARSTLQKAIKIYCNGRGVEKTSLHLFRHTFITNAVNKNVNPLVLKSITGHSSIKELNRYYNSRSSDLVAVIDDIAPKTNKKEKYFKKRGSK